MSYAAWVVASFLLAACARGRGPGIEGPQANDLFASYSGSWVIYTPASIDPIAYGGPIPRPPANSGVAGRASGGGPGATSGTGRGSDVGPRRVTYDSGAWAVIQRMARTRPAKMELALTPELFSLRLDEEEPMLVPMQGDEVEIEREGRVVGTALRWEEGRPRLERSIENEGKVVDRFEALASGRLMVSRRFEGSLLGPQELRFVYTREPKP